MIRKASIVGLLFGIAVAVLLTATIVSAEDVTRKAGDRSLNFSLVRSQLQTYKFGIGAKYWTSDTAALSGSVDVSDDKTENNDSSGYPAQSTYDSSFYGVSFALERHLQTASKLSPYLGGELTYEHWEYQSSYVISSGITSASLYNSTQQRFGVGLLAGAEYALNKSVSLAGEYSYGFSYSSTVSEDSMFGTRTGRSRGFNLSVGRLMLLLYF